MLNQWTWTNPKRNPPTQQALRQPSRVQQALPLRRNRLHHLLPRARQHLALQVQAQTHHDLRVVPPRALRARAHRVHPARVPRALRARAHRVHPARVPHVLRAQAHRAHPAQAAARRVRAHPGPARRPSPAPVRRNAPGPAQARARVSVPPTVKIAPRHRAAIALRREVLARMAATGPLRVAIAHHKVAIVRAPVVPRRPSLRSNRLFRKL